MCMRNQIEQKEVLVGKVLDATIQTNSLVENINSKLRTYFNLKRELGNEYLEFLQFFLKHRRFIRNEYKKSREKVSQKC